MPLSPAWTDAFLFSLVTIAVSPNHEGADTRATSVPTSDGSKGSFLRVMTAVPSTRTKNSSPSVPWKMMVSFGSTCRGGCARAEIRNRVTRGDWSEMSERRRTGSE